MRRPAVFLAILALALAPSIEARRLWQFPGFGAPATAGPAMPAGAGAGPDFGGFGSAEPTAPTAGAGAGPAAGAAAAGGDADLDAIINKAVASAVEEATGGRPAAGAAGAGAAAGAGPAGAASAAGPTQPAAATATSSATAVGTPQQPAAASATATGTPGRPGAATAVADPTQGVAAGATGASQATAAAGEEAVTATGEEEEPAAPAGPKVLRPGVYVIADPPPPPKRKPVPAAGVGAVGNATAGANATLLPPPTPTGKNLMVVMTVMGQQARDIYKNQAAIRQQVADAAGVPTEQVLFYNQTTNGDPRTGVTAMSLIMNVDCGNEAVCSKAGKQLFNSSSQTRLTDGLARNQVSMLPGTFQVYGVPVMGKYRGNTTLYENKALTAIRPKAPESDLSYNETLAKVFAGFDEPAAAAGPTKGKKPTGALPGDIPLAGPEAFAGLNLSSMQQPTFDGMPAGGLGNFSSMGLPSLGGMPATLPGLENTTEPEEPAPKKARSSAGSFTAGALPLLAAAAAMLML